MVEVRFHIWMGFLNFFLLVALDDLLKLDWGVVSKTTLNLLPPVYFQLQSDVSRTHAILRRGIPREQRGTCSRPRR